MCAGALLQARVEGVVYGARNQLLGADGSWISMLPQQQGNTASCTDIATSNLPDTTPYTTKATVSKCASLESAQDDVGAGQTARLEAMTSGIGPRHPFHPDLWVVRGVLEEECSSILKDFFRKRRRQAAKQQQQYCTHCQ